MYEHNIIVAMCKFSRGIGYKNRLPWYIPEELKKFKTITTQNYCPDTRTNYDALYMGRNTYLSLHNSLPKRDLFVISSDPDSIIKHIPCTIFRSIEECKTYTANNKYKSLWCIGGQTTYNNAVYDKSVKKIVISEIHKPYTCDVYFPYLPKYFLKYDDDIYNGNSKSYQIKTYLNMNT